MQKLPASVLWTKPPPCVVPHGRNWFFHELQK
jgi:hypothetical protein